MRLLGFGFRAPNVAVPGTNFAGVVEAVGPDVTAYQPGDEVYGATRGTFAEYAVASVDKMAPKPPQLSFEQAAVLPYPTFVAMQALRDHGHVQPGQRVLLVGDYTTEDFADGSRRFDLVLDIGGRTSVARLRRALTRTGTLVILGGEGDRWVGGIQRQLWAQILSPFVRQKLIAFVVKENADELLRLNDLVAAGKVTPVLGPTYPLADGAAAVADLERAGSSGRPSPRQLHPP
jgi:NADPH:quinone reductase-like Zn-dependent oxidoreductase